MLPPAWGVDVGSGGGVWGSTPQARIASSSVRATIRVVHRFWLLVSFFSLYEIPSIYANSKGRPTRPGAHVARAVSGPHRPAIAKSTGDGHGRLCPVQRPPFPHRLYVLAHHLFQPDIVAGDARCILDGVPREGDGTPARKHDVVGWSVDGGGRWCLCIGCGRGGGRGGG